MKTCHIQNFCQLSTNLLALLKPQKIKWHKRPKFVMLPCDEIGHFEQANRIMNCGAQAEERITKGIIQQGGRLNRAGIQ